MTMCSYCSRHYPDSEVVPLFEKGKTNINYYCPNCTPKVKSNLIDYGKKLRQIGVPNVYRFGEKGEKPPNFNE